MFNLLNCFFNFQNKKFADLQQLIADEEDSKVEAVALYLKQCAVQVEDTLEKITVADIIGKLLQKIFFKSSS